MLKLSLRNARKGKAKKQTNKEGTKRNAPKRRTAGKPSIITARIIPGIFFKHETSTKNRHWAAGTADRLKRHLSET